MNRIIPLILTYLLSHSAFAASTAAVNLICLSPQVFPATTRERLTGLDWTISVSTDPNNANNEMGLAPLDVPYSHEGYFIFIDPTTFEPAPMQFVLDVPSFADVNTNGIYDFFDPAAGITNVVTEGQRQNAPGGSSAVDFTATWTREAGASSGTVIFDFSDFPGLRFTHGFNLVDYAGTLNYTRDSNVLSGNLLVTNVLASDDMMAGPISITVSNNESLSYTAGSWSGIGGFTYQYSPTDTLDRVGLNYISVLEFTDGFAGTSDPDYQDWLFIISSTDSNTNGIPDLVETATSLPPPSLEIVKTAGGIELRVHGTTGQSYSLEAVDLLGNNLAGVWQTIQTVSLTSDPQTIPMSSSGQARYFRLRQG